MIGDFTFEQLLLVAGFAFFTQILGGIAGYGTGLLLPLVRRTCSVGGTIPGEGVGRCGWGGCGLSLRL